MKPKISELIMIRLIIFLILFPSLVIIAHDWQLFNTDYKSFYLQKEYFTNYPGNYDKVLEIQFKKKEIAENHFLFTSERLDEKYNSDTCMLGYRKKSMHYFEAYDFLIDRYEIRNDTLWYYYENYGQIIDTSIYIYLPLNLQINNSYYINNLEYKLIERDFKEIIPGISDSVMVFSVKSDNYTDSIQISQHFGILKLNNLKIYTQGYIYLKNIKIIGYENNLTNEKIGFIPRKMQFKDLIHFKEGDTRFWSFYNDGINWYHGFYCQDTIISRVLTKDSLILKFKRIKYYNYSPVSVDDLIESYNIKDWENLLSDRQNSFQKIWYNYWDNWEQDWENFHSIVQPNGYILNNNSKIDSLLSSDYNQFCLEDYGNFIYQDCKVDMWTDHHAHNFYAPYIGMYFSYTFGTDNQIVWNLKAYKLNGKFYGKIPDKFYSINDDVNKTIAVYPNPASDYFTLNITPFFEEGVRECSVSIFDVFGNKVLTVAIDYNIETQNFVSLQKIDISTLPAGVYFIQIGEIVQKFVKI
ncbi:MAG: hypothetical protein A2X64_04180 [Ignavibacteria bacterium GWF2_33_9]|nr:MAG: hypothetical protein A2X64_04180 [Ignavibacteria bacterium GWF2_33_9]